MYVPLLCNYGFVSEMLPKPVVVLDLDPVTSAGVQVALSKLEVFQASCLREWLRR